MLINSWLARAQMWAVMLRQESVAIFMEGEVGKLLRDLCVGFVRVELLALTPLFHFLFLLFAFTWSLQGGCQSRLNVWTSIVRDFSNNLSKSLEAPLQWFPGFAHNL